MESVTRREAIYETLSKAIQPIKGSELAKMYQVSRQVIVQDIALLRAKGIQVVATPSGYMIQEPVASGLLKTICCKHGHTIEELQTELELIISYGGKVIDVIVEHPVYGEIRVILNLNYLKDVKTFIEKVSQAQTKPLSLLTEGIHYHTLEVENEQMYQEIINELKQHHFIHERLK